MLLSESTEHLLSLELSLFFLTLTFLCLISNDTNSDSTSKLSSPRPQSSPTLQLSQNLQTNEESQHQILKSSSQTLSDTTSSNDVPVYPLKTQLKTPLLSSNTSTKTKYIFDDHEIRESEQDSKCTCCTIVWYWYWLISNTIHFDYSRELYHLIPFVVLCRVQFKRSRSSLSPGVKISLQSIKNSPSSKKWNKIQHIRSCGIV